MIALSQVLWLVRELFARQIDRESDDLRERLLRELCDVLALDTPDRSDPVRDVLREAARCGDPTIEAKAERALKILAVIETLDALAAHKREAELEALFGDARAKRDDALRRAGAGEAETRRREAAGE